MSSEIDKLTQVMQSFILANTEQSTELRVNQNHLTKAVTELNASMKIALESNTRLEEKVTSLEDRALDRLDLVEDSVNEISAKHDLVDKRVQILESINSYEQGVASAYNSNQNKSNNSWTRILSALSVIVAIVAVVYTMFGGVPKP